MSSTPKRSTRRSETSSDALDGALVPERRDLLDALAGDHRLLTSRGRHLVDATPPDQRAIDRWAGDVTVHELIEELVVDPLMRGPLARPDLADRRAEEQRTLLRVLDELRDRPPVAPAELRGVLDRFVEHSDREEIEVFPALRRAVSPGDLVAAWHRFVLLRTRIPSRCAMLAGPRSWRSSTGREVARSLERRVASHRQGKDRREAAEGVGRTRTVLSGTRSTEERSHPVRPGG